MKRILAIAAFAVGFLPVAAFAATVDVPQSITIVLSADSSTYTFSSNTGVEDLAVGTDSFTVKLVAGQVADITSSDRKKLENDGSFTYTCESGQSLLHLVNNPGNSTSTVTVTPTSSCSSPGGGGGSGGGGGGGGGGGVPVSPPAPRVSAPAPSPATLLPASLSAPASLGGGAIFTSTLDVGSQNPDVTRLQTLLRSDPAVYPEGSVTGYFGALTRNAVRRFQLKYGVIQREDESGNGVVGRKTRAKLAEVFGRGVALLPSPATPAPTVAEPSSVARSVSPVFATGMRRGVTSDDARRLQVFLNSDPETRIASSGPGSPGNETGYFGALTVQAVQKFQMKYGVVSSSEDRGYGSVGPKTRAKFAEVFGSGVPESSSSPTPSPAPPTSSGAPAGAATEVQIDSILGEIERIQAQINALLAP